MESTYDLKKVLKTRFQLGVLTGIVIGVAIVIIALVIAAHTVV